MKCGFSSTFQGREYSMWAKNCGLCSECVSLEALRKGASTRFGLRNVDVGSAFQNRLKIYAPQTKILEG
jgi:hypothetical protein